MIFQRLTLHDFGVYAGRQEIELAPPSKSRPIVLVGGLNGSGKTTLLDALQLALYGDQARTSNRGTMAYHEYLARSINRNSVHGEASIALSFRHRTPGSESSYHIHRSWRKSAKGAIESFAVVRDGIPNPVLASNWMVHVQTMLPVGISHLFFFDGEKVESYASSDRTPELIETGILKLLGLDTVDQLFRDLKAFERRKQPEKATPADDGGIRQFQSEISRAEGRLSALRREAATINTKLVRKEASLQQIKRKFQISGGDFYVQRAELEEALAQRSIKRKEIEEILHEHAKGALPLAMVVDILHDAVEFSVGDRKHQEAILVSKVLEGRDEVVLDLLKNRKVEPSLVGDIARFLQEDRESRTEQTSLPPSIGLPDETPPKLQLLIQEILNHATTAAHSDVSGYREILNDIKILEEKLAQVPDSKEFAQLLSRQNALEKEIGGIRKSKDRTAIQIQSATEELERLESRLATLLEAATKEKIGERDRIRLVQHSLKARETLKLLRDRVIRHNILRIERLVLECFHCLLRKKTLVQRIAIDPQKFSLSLFSPDETRIEADRLSAGERQLLAIATLWGLAKASGRPLPTAIDTPLGRLDGNHRDKLVENYFPDASHQVILFSTDEEITQHYLERLQFHVGHYYCLIYDDGTASTSITRGYFNSIKV